MRALVIKDHLKTNIEKSIFLRRDIVIAERAHIPDTNCSQLHLTAQAQRELFTLHRINIKLKHASTSYFELNYLKSPEKVVRFKLINICLLMLSI